MTTPDVPLRIEFSIEVPGTPEQVWAALATGAGITSWFLPTDVEEREGGTFVTHMGETDSPGTVTGWDPPRRFAYEEPEWAALGGHPEAEVTPLASEFLVEARSGGTCVVRVVSSAFGTGADWEHEFIDEMQRYWVPFFEHHLRLYLARFAGQQATTRTLEVDATGSPDGVQDAIVRALDATEVGRPVEGLGLQGHVERTGDPYLLLSVTDPVPGYVSLFTTARDGGGATAQIVAWLFGDDAPAFAEQLEPTWRAWLEGVTAGDGAPAPAARR